MSKILLNLKEIPVPSDAHINKNDNRVYALIPPPSGLDSFSLFLIKNSEKSTF